jgi:hypothetical protein
MVATGRQYRVWIVHCPGWQAESFTDVPPQAIAVEPAEEMLMSAADAGVYIESFNQIAHSQSAGHWAIAIPVRLRYEGDLTAGEAVDGRET